MQQQNLYHQTSFIFLKSR